MNQNLTTERLSLLPCGLERFPETYRLWTNDEIKRFLFDDRTISEAEARSFIESSAQTFAADGYGIWLVFRREETENPIGFAGLLKSDTPIPNLIYGLHPNFWRRGFAREAARGVLDDAFHRLALPAVRADVDEPNRPSVGVLEKLGMQLIGRSIVDGKPLLYFEISRARFARNLDASS